MKLPSINVATGLLTVYASTLSLTAKICTVTLEEVNDLIQDLSGIHDPKDDIKKVDPADALLRDVIDQANQMAEVFQFATWSVSDYERPGGEDISALQDKRDEGEEWIHCLMAAAKQMADDGFEGSAADLMDVAMDLLEELETY